MVLHKSTLKVRKIERGNDKLITIRKHLVALQQDYIKYRGLYENIPDLCRTINTDGIIIDCNKSYAMHLGYNKEEVIGKSIFEHVDPEDNDSLKETFEEWKKTGRITNKHVLLKRKDGTTLPAIITVTNLYNIDGSIQGSNTILKDISDLEMLTEYFSTKKELEMKDAEKEKFVSMVSHDLKNLIAPIKLYCELLEDTEKFGTLNLDQVDAVNEIDQSLDKLDRLVSDIHDIHKLDLKQMKFEKKDFDVNQLIKSVMKSHFLTMSKNKIKFVNNSAQQISTIKSDEGRLFQVFLNLIKNGKDFLPQKNPKIEIGAIDHPQYIIFYVKDNGMGIAPEKQEKLFNEFFQLDDINQGRHIGSGLGLTICKGIVDGLGGRIWIDSKEMVGTTFYFSTPKGDK